MQLCSPAAHLLCGPVPNGARTGTDPRPRGWGPLLYKVHVTCPLMAVPFAELDLPSHPSPAICCDGSVPARPPSAVAESLANSDSLALCHRIEPVTFLVLHR